MIEILFPDGKLYRYSGNLDEPWETAQWKLELVELPEYVNYAECWSTGKFALPVKPARYIVPVDISGGLGK